MGMSSKRVTPVATTLTFPKFWTWLQGHVNCIVRAGTPEVVLFDHDDFHWTLLAEAVYPENRVVVDYGGCDQLPLLALRDRRTGDYADLPLLRRTAAALGLPVPRTFDHLDTIEGIHQALRGMSANEEGFVALFADGQRFKFKSSAYL